MRTDAAWRSEDKAGGLGWIIQAEGQSATFKKFIPSVSSPLVAEGLAIREALVMCKEMKFHSVKIECDSSQLVKASKGTELVADLHGIL